MGHFCWMCERSRPNEAFSGRKHGQHLCRECARLPRSVRERKERLESLWSMLLRQRVISTKNVGMAMEWAGSEDQEVAPLARIVADIGRVHPGRKRRLPFLRNHHPELWARMVAAGVVYEFPEYEAEIAHYESDIQYSPADDGTEEIIRDTAEADDYDEWDEIPF